MYDTLCTLPLSADLLSQAIHPKNPILSVGLASGVVQTFRLPAPDAEYSPSKSSENSISKPKKSKARRTSILSDSSSATDGTGFISTAWRTKRHKGSCRTIAYSLDGEELFSAGTDGIVKIAKAEDGRVKAKIRVPLHNSNPDHPTKFHPLSSQTLLLGTEAPALHIFDLRAPNSSSTIPTRPQATFYPHDDYISSITSLPPTSESTSGASKQCITTGGNTLAVTDFRRGVLAKSEEQDEELLCSALVNGLGGGKKRKPGGGGSSSGEKVVVGDADGVLSLWQKGEWEDRGGERVVLSGGGESVDCVVAIPGDSGKLVAGLGSGFLVMVDMAQRKELEAYRHDELEGVAEIGFEVGGRMVSGGGTVVKVWGKRKEGEEGDSEEELEVASREDDDGEEEVDLRPEPKEKVLKRSVERDESSDEEDSSSEEEEKKRKRKKKKKRRKGKENGGSKPAVLGFAGLD